MFKKEKTQHQVFITKSVYVYTTKRDTLGDTTMKKIVHSKNV